MRLVTVVSNTLRRLCRLASFIALPTLLLAQSSVDMLKTITQYANPPGLASGTPDDAYALSAAEAIDAFSGHLSYDLPLVRVGGRGNAGYTVSLKIPSRWEATSTTHCVPTQNYGTVCNPTRFEAMFGSWQSAGAGYGPGSVYLRRTGSFGTCNYVLNNPSTQEYRMTSSRTTMIFVDSHGTEHELFDLSSLNGQYFWPNSPGGACADSVALPTRGRVFARATDRR